MISAFIDKYINKIPDNKRVNFALARCPQNLIQTCLNSFGMLLLPDNALLGSIDSYICKASTPSTPSPDETCGPY